MKKDEAKQLVQELKKWFQKEAGESIAYRIILESFEEASEWNNDAYIAAIPFETLTTHPSWTISKDDNCVVSRINAMRETMDDHLCPFRSVAHVTQEDGMCFLILGSDQVDVIRNKKANKNCLRNVKLWFDDAQSDGSDLVRFNQGTHVKISANSPLKGFVYLYSIDASKTISPIYPLEGGISELSISENSKRNLNGKINELIEKASPYANTPPLMFSGNATGKERVVAMVTSKPVPVTIAHLKSRIPLPLLYSHELKTKGIGDGQINSTNDFNSLSLNQIAIGTLDYFYNG